MDDNIVHNYSLHFNWFDVSYIRTIRGLSAFDAQYPLPYSTPHFLVTLFSYYSRINNIVIYAATEALQNDQAHCSAESFTCHMLSV